MVEHATHAFRVGHAQKIKLIRWQREHKTFCKSLVLIGQRNFITMFCAAIRSIRPLIKSAIFDKYSGCIP